MRSDRNKQLELLKNSILKLPSINVQILDLLMRLFHIVTRNNEINSMGPDNIGLWCDTRVVVTVTEEKRERN